MKSFIKDVLSENGSASSKRVAFFILLGVFIGQLAVDLIWGRLLSDMLRDQLFELLVITLGTVVGVTVLNGIKDIKIAQSNNNATVGSPSPPPEPPAQQ